MSDYNNGNQGQWTQGPGGQNQYPGGPGAPDPMRQDQPRPRNGYATVSMICGIFGILCLCCFAFPLAIILGVGAVCFAIISKRGQPFYATAIFGIVLGVRDRRVRLLYGSFQPGKGSSQCGSDQ